MADVVDKATRRRMMAGIRGKDTRPEIAVRKALHRRGFRYKLNDRTLPGQPDIVLPRHRAVIFVHGCFWHMHDCHLFKWPTTRPDFWKKKLTGNRQRDERVLQELAGRGWRVLVIWECSLKGKNKIGLDALIQLVTQWIESGEPVRNIP